jgi:hypothetical protein
MPSGDGFDKQELAKELADGAQKTAQEIIVRAQLAGLISFFLPTLFYPAATAVTAGLAAVNVGLAQLANKRFYARLEQLRDAMNARLEEVGESNVNKDWFQSEEGQTMLFEAVRQVASTSDRKKIAMLGNALANGGVTDFSSEERKELFLQLVRDLTPQHIAVLRRLMPDQSSAWKLKIEGKGEELLVLQMLHASGLVTESLEPMKAQVRLRRYGSAALSANNVARGVKELEEIIKDLQRPPRRVFALSTLGKDFIEFVNLRRIE